MECAVILAALHITEGCNVADADLGKKILTRVVAMHTKLVSLSGVYVRDEGDAYEESSTPWSGVHQPSGMR